MSAGREPLGGDPSHLASILEHQLLYLVEGVPVGVWPREEASVLHSATQQ